MRRLSSALLIALTGGLMIAEVSVAAPVTVKQEGDAASVLDDPHVAVDDAGTAHVVTHLRRDGATVVEYCRLPRGATDCAARRSFAVNTAGNAPPVIRYQPPSTVAFVLRECCQPAFGRGNAQTVAFISSDLGTTFGPPVKLAPADGAGENAVLPADAILVGGTFGWVNSVSTFGHDFQAAAVGGGLAGTAADLFETGRFDAAVGLTDPAAFTPLVVSEDDSGPLSFRRLIGGDPNAEASWTLEQGIDAEGDEPELAEGPGGLYLTYAKGAPGAMRTYVRRFTGTGFGPASDTGLAYGDGNDVAQDGAGKLYVVADDNRQIRLTTSPDAGATWSPPADVTTGESGLGNVHVDVAADGGGWVVYTTSGGAVRAVELPGAAVAGAFATKLEILRAAVRRAERRLSVLAPISGRASGGVRVAFRAAGRTERFTAEVDGANRRVRINRAIPAAQARLGTGILTMTYAGDEDTQPQEVRLRAASRQARLVADRPKLTGNRLTAQGRISARARGVVRLQVLYEPPDGPTKTLRFAGQIRNGRYEIDLRMPPKVVSEIAARRGVVHTYTLFTGYLPARVRGEMRSYQLLGAR